MKLTLVRTHPETAHVTSFFFRSEAPLNYAAGQYMTWKLPHEPADNRGVERWFTIASSPTDEFIQLTTKFSQPSSSFKQGLQLLQPGNVIEADQVDSDFTLVKHSNQPMLFIAGGIGVTPFHSMLGYMAHERIKQPVQLIYAAQTTAEFAFKSQLDTWSTDLPLTINYVPEYPAAGWAGPSGRLDANMIKNLAGTLSGKLIYISGPEGMVKALRDQLIGTDVAAEQIKIDDFPGYTQI